MSERTRARVLGPTDGETGSLGSIGVRFMIAGKDPGEHVSLVEHPMPARTLAAPMHRHSREDEYSSGARYGSEFDFDSIARLIDEHGLRFGLRPSR
jgi:hypothetical protein